MLGRMRWSIALGILLTATIMFVAAAQANAQPSASPAPSASGSGGASPTAKEEARAHFEKGLSPSRCASNRFADLMSR